MADPDQPSPRERVSILQTITAPLGFYVLTLFIVETFLSVTVFALSGTDRSLSMYLGVGMFVAVVLMVSLIVIVWPEKLLFMREDYLDRRVRELERDFQLYRRIDELLRDATFFRSQKRYADARIFYEKARQLDPTSEEAIIGLAVVLSYGDPPEYSRAITELDGLLRRDPKCAKAYYNRACFKKLMGAASYQREEWLHDLSQAVKHRSNFSEFATKDEDFTSEHDKDDFRQAIKIPPS